MKKETKLTCISCPLGCELTVTTDESGENISVSGNICKRGEVYGIKEVTAPTRMVTSTVAVRGSDKTVLPVRTKTDIPKGKIFDCMKEIIDAVADAPVDLGDVIIKDVAGTGVDVIATSPAHIK